ncbi:HD domain-containing phosphohydrolase, partial [Curvivirga aplysinae]|uniref:HD domain-containing phosphohydrolase n=1 Tax=Curvivirga aplysinae TaxID=2529852 RepID=UPI0012BC0054
DVVENLPGALFHYWLSPDGKDKIHFVNEGCKEIWEITTIEAERDASLLWDMVLDADLEKLQNSIEKSAEKLSRWSHQWRIKTPSGKIKWLQGLAKARPTDDGGVYWNTLILDITAEKEADHNKHLSYAQTIEVLSAALEARDPYTAGHSRSVARICEDIANEMGLSQNFIDGLILGALVHDIGKIQIPSAILTKPTKLSDAEYNLVQQHAINGASLLQQTSFEWPIYEMVAQHHERCDGSGYPNGLTADKIILEAKIIAVADTIESMATNRPYRFAPGLSKAIQVIKDGSGTKFDQKVVNAALNLYQDLESLPTN